METTPENVQSPARRPPRRWQWSLTTLLLLTAVIGAWTAYFHASRESARLREAIAALQPLTRTLVVEDESQFAVVEQHEEWYDDDKWDLWLPPGQTYRLKLATEGIEDKSLAEPQAAAAIEPGRHELTLLKEKDGGKISLTVTLDGQTLLEAAATDAENHGSSDNVSYERGQQLPVAQPLVLKRRKFMTRQADGKTFSTKNSGPGILLWIEAEKGGD